MGESVSTDSEMAETPDTLFGRPQAASPGQAAGGEGDQREEEPSMPIVTIAGDGEVLLKVTFLTSEETIKAARKAAAVASRAPATGSGGTTVPNPALLKPRVIAIYRVRLAPLTGYSRYFRILFNDRRFREAQKVDEALADLAARHAPPSQDEADILGVLPIVEIVDDDELTQAPAQERMEAMAHILRVLHSPSLGRRAEGEPTVPRDAKARAAARGRVAVSSSSPSPGATATISIRGARGGRGGAAPVRPQSMRYLATLAIMADRLNCALAFRDAGKLPLNWPMMNRGSERALRQQILAAWLLSLPPKLQQATQQLIFSGSSRWGSILAGDEETDIRQAAVWWSLPDNLEDELRFRRECMLNTIASVQRHFLALYASRDRQCALGYDTSAACDSFQFGQMLRYFTSKGMLAMVDFGPSSLESLPDMPVRDLSDLLLALRQCPNYPLDKYHTSCGIRKRMEPILDFLDSMLSSDVVSIDWEEWWGARDKTSWLALVQTRAHEGGGIKVLDGVAADEKRFEYRRVARDERFRSKGALGSRKMARMLFTAESWDWNAL